MFKLERFQSFLLGACLVSGVAMAKEPANAESQEERPKETDYVEEVVVAATRSERALTEAPGAVTVITKEQIARTPAQDLADVLRFAPSTSLSGQGVGGRSTISLRGMTDAHTLVMVDGRRVAQTDDVIGHSDFRYNWVPLDTVERIEIVRGPLSALWGSDALGGVINIVTQQASREWGGQLSLRHGFLGRGEGGDELGGSLHFGGELLPRQLSARFSLSTLRADEIPDRDNPELTQIEERDLHDASMRLEYTIDPHQTLSFDTSLGEEQRWNRSARYDRTYDLQRDSLALAYQGVWQGLLAEAEVYRYELESVYTRSTGGKPSLNLVGDTVVDGHLVLPAKRGPTWTFGGQLRFEEVEANGFNHGAGGTGTADQSALFLQGEFQLGSRTFVTTGGRLDNHEFFGSEFSPRLSLIQQLSPTLSLKAGYGHGFKAPSLKRLTPDYLAIAGPHSFVGNPDLRPEISDSYELGIEQRSGKLFWRVMGFHNDIDDLISWLCIENCGGGGRRVFKGFNVERAQTRGIEAEFVAQMTSRFELRADVTFLEAEDELTGEDLSNRPDRTGNLAVTYTGPQTGFSTTLRYQHMGDQLLTSRRVAEIVDGYGMFHLQVSHPLSETLIVRVGVENLTDEQVEDISPLYDYAERGRFFYTGIDFRF